MHDRFPGGHQFGDTRVVVLYEGFDTDLFTRHAPTPPLPRLQRPLLIVTPPEHGDPRAYVKTKRGWSLPLLKAAFQDVQRFDFGYVSAPRIFHSATLHASP